MPDELSESVCMALSRLRDAGTSEESHARWADLVEAHDAWLGRPSLYTIRWRSPDGVRGGYDVALPLDKAEFRILALRARWPRFEFWPDPV